MLEKSKIKIKDYYKLSQNIIKNLDELENRLSYCEQGEELYIYREIENKNHKFDEIVKILYFNIVEYLEKNQSYQILNIFKASYDEIFKKNYKLIFRAYDEDYGEYFHYSPKLESLSILLEPFNILGERDMISANYLENILNSTDYLLKKFNVNIINETSINNSIRVVLQSIFNDVSNIHEPFIKVAKSYKPDICLPSLKTCIEYKFARDENRFINTIGEIYEDVHGYSNHHQYTIFYVVFYFVGTYPQHRFHEIIKEKKFPKEWKFLLINGS